MLASILQKFSITKSPHADGEGLNAEHNNIPKLIHAARIPAVFLLDRNLNNTHYDAPVKAQGRHCILKPSTSRELVL